jgi:hypothetical protein
MAHPSHPPRLDYSNYTWRRVQIMKLLIIASVTIKEREKMNKKIKTIENIAAIDGTAK